MMPKFLQNKYYRWYKAIMVAAKARGKLQGYTERHHIKPRALGGSNKKSNLVHLTYREHFLAHWLLTKFTMGKDQINMFHSLVRMSSKGDGRKIVASWQYEIAKKAARDAMMSLPPEERVRKAKAASILAMKQAKSCGPNEMSRRGKIGGPRAGAITALLIAADPEKWRQIGKKAAVASLAAFGRAERSQAARAGRAAIPMEEKQRQGRLAGLASAATHTPEELSHRSKIGHQKRIQQEIFQNWQSHSATWAGQSRI